MDLKKPGYKTTEFIGHPLATGLITSGVGMLYAMPSGLGPALTLAAGLGLVAAGTIVQVSYNLSRVGLKKAVAEAAPAPEAAPVADVGAAFAAALPTLLAALGGASVPAPALKKEEPHVP